MQRVKRKRKAGAVTEERKWTKQEVHEFQAEIRRQIEEMWQHARYQHLMLHGRILRRDDPTAWQRAKADMVFLEAFRHCPEKFMALANGISAGASSSGATPGSDGANGEEARARSNP
jgi:hypothetical protein